MAETALVQNKSSYKLNGLACSSCAAKIEKAVQEVPYVEEAELNFAIGRITVKGDSGKINQMTADIQEIADRIENGILVEKEGEKTSGSSKQKYLLEGLTCSNCATRIETAVNNLPQVEKAELNFATSTIAVDGSITPETLQEITDRIEPGVTVRRAGRRNRRGGNLQDHKHGQSRDHGHEEKHEHDNSHGHSQGTGNQNSYLKFRFFPGIVIFALAIVFFEIPAMQVRFSGLPIYLEWLLYGASYLLIGGPVLAAAFKNIIRGQLFDENFLMGIATIGAFAIQQFPEGVAVMLFYMVGEMFQERAVDRSRRSIKSLMDIRPDYANLKEGDDTYQVDPEDVEIGDIIIIRPGEKVPLDGKVLEGKSMLDTSALTGESVPRKVEPGEKILSGTINKEGLLTVEVTSEFGESTVSKILDLVENASGKKAPTEKFITKFSRYYTPVVVFSALAIAVVPPIFVPGAVFSDWLYRALIFLVVSCPCALVVSIPLGFFGGIGRASRQGILVKGGNYLEALNNVNQIVFDKTGTLTKGEFAVTKVETYNGFGEDELLTKAAYAESHSNHPIAKSILEAYDREIEKERIEDYQEVSGHGIKARIDGQEVLAGNTKLMEKESIDYQQADEDGTIVYLAFDNKFAGYITISDDLKDDTLEAIRGLKEAGIQKLTMLTGDRKAVAGKIARKLGLDSYYAELLPDQKVEKVEELLSKQGKKDKLIFVGDGINDAPVLARSDIGVAMGGLGSDAAIEAADIVLMTDEPYKIVTALDTARRTRNIVWQNVGLAMGIKGIVLVMGALGVATMWEAVFADVGVALLAVLNAMRISRKVVS